jgi:hypothetical protein
MVTDPRCHRMNLVYQTFASAPEWRSLHLCFDEFVNVFRPESKKRSQPNAANPRFAAPEVVAHELRRDGKRFCNLHRRTLVSDGEATPKAVKELAEISAN